MLSYDCYEHIKILNEQLVEIIFEKNLKFTLLTTTLV